MLLKMNIIKISICLSHYIIQARSSEHDYGEAIRESLLFYEAQRSGKLPQDNRIPWRGDSALGDTGNQGQDLTGGYYDAGDFMKLGFPLASTLTLLSWGGISHKEGYANAGELDHLKLAVSWGINYILRCHVAEDQLYGQVGKSNLDHDYWGRPEDMTMERPAFKISPSKPGSDLAGESAAALAAASILMEDKDGGHYSEMLVNHAQQLFKLADEHRGKYQDSITDADTSYPSYDFKDELAWAAAWLFKVTGDAEYLDKALTYYEEGDLPYATEFSWDDKGPGVMILLAELTAEERFKEDLQRFCDSMIYDKPRSPKGMVFISKWGSLRYAANVAFICLQAAKLGINSEDYMEFSKQQIDYILGDAGHSFVVGFGHNPPQRPHHAAASCPDPPATCDWNNFNSPDPNPHVLKGALVGGPKAADDVWIDDRTDYISNEVALDYNAGFQGALAAFNQQTNKN